MTASAYKRKFRSCKSEFGVRPSSAISGQSTDQNMCVVTGRERPKASTVNGVCPFGLGPIQHINGDRKYLSGGGDVVEG